MLRPIGSYFSWGRGSGSSASSEDSRSARFNHGPGDQEPPPRHVHPWPADFRPGLRQLGVTELQECFWLEGNLREKDNQLGEFSLRISEMQASATSIRRDLEDLQKSLASISKRRPRRQVKFVKVQAEDRDVQKTSRGLVPLELTRDGLTDPPTSLSGMGQKFAALVTAHANTPLLLSTESQDSRPRDHANEALEELPVNATETPVMSPAYTIEPPPASHEVVVEGSSARLFPSLRPSPLPENPTKVEDETSKPDPRLVPRPLQLKKTGISTMASVPAPVSESTEEQQDAIPTKASGLIPPTIATEEDQEQSSLDFSDTIVEATIILQTLSATNPDEQEGNTLHTKPQTPQSSTTPASTEPTKPPASTGKEDDRTPRSMPPSAALQYRFPLNATEEAPKRDAGGTRLVQHHFPLKAVEEAPQRTAVGPRSVQSRFPLTSIGEASQKITGETRTKPLGLVKRRFPPLSDSDTKTSKRASLKPVVEANKVSRMAEFWSKREGGN